MKACDFIAREGETFMLSSGEYEDVCIHGPFVATRDIPAQETAQAFADWLSAADRGSVIELMEDVAADLAFAQARLGDYRYDAESAGLAAWLVREGAAVPTPCQVFQVQAGRNARAQSVIIHNAREQVEEFVQASADLEGPQQRPGM